MPSKNAELGKLNITFIEGKDLPVGDSNGFSDPYVVVKSENTPGLYFRDGGSIKTSVQKKTLNPVWNESFEVLWDFQFRKMTIRVWDYDRWSFKDDYLGKCRLYMEDFRDQQEHEVWVDLINNRKENANRGKIKIKFRAVSPFPILALGNSIKLDSEDYIFAVGRRIKGGFLDGTTSSGAMVGLNSEFQVLDTFNHTTNNCYEGMANCMEELEDDDEYVNDWQTFSVKLGDVDKYMKYILVCNQIWNGNNSYSVVRGSYVRVLKQHKKKSETVLLCRENSSNLPEAGLVHAVLKRRDSSEGWDFIAVEHNFFVGNDITDEVNASLANWAREYFTK